MSWCRSAVVAGCLILVVLPQLFAADSAASPVVDTSRVLPGGERLLEQSIVIPAPVEEVWNAFTTTEGFRSWAVPVASIDFRLGGIMESSYSLDAAIGDEANIRNQLLAYVPHRMIAFRNVSCPPNAQFDAETFQRLHTVVSFEPKASDSTLVVITQPGYGEGESYDGVYRHFEWGNRWTLEKLKERFERGPIDWAARAAARN